VSVTGSFPGESILWSACWKAYREGDELQTPFVIKDSWQYPEREEEGELLREATEKGVVNVARYYHHETVRVGGEDDDVCKNVRKGLEITKAINYNARGSIIFMDSNQRPETLTLKPLYNSVSSGTTTCSYTSCLTSSSSNPPV